MLEVELGLQIRLLCQRPQGGDDVVRTRLRAAEEATDGAYVGGEAVDGRRHVGNALGFVVAVAEGLEGLLGFVEQAEDRLGAEFRRQPALPQPRFPTLAGGVP